MNDIKRLKEGWTTVGIKKAVLVKLKTAASIEKSNATTMLEKILVEFLQKYDGHEEFEKTEAKVLKVLALKQDLKNLNKELETPA